MSIEIDNRHGQRIQANTPAWVQAGKLFPCTVGNIGHGGAMLSVSTDIAFPTNFTLRLTADGRVKRSCRTVWQKDGRMGVRFVRADGTPHPAP